MKAKHFLCFTTIACCAILSFETSAQDFGFYLGGNVGRTQANWDTTGGFVIPGGTLNSINQDTSETAWKLYAGYQFTKYLGVEAEYVDFGRYNFNGTATVPPVGFAFNGNVKIDGYGLVGVGTLPLSDSFSVLGKLGVFYSHESGSLTVLGLSAGGSDNKTRATYGVGLKYAFNHNLSVRAEIERFPGMGSSSGNTENVNVNLYSIGVGYKF